MQYTLMAVDRPTGAWSTGHTIAEVRAGLRRVGGRWQTAELLLVVGDAGAHFDHAGQLLRLPGAVVLRLGTVSGGRQ